VEGHTVQAPPEERRHSVSGLDQPRLRATGEVIMSINKKKLRAENWRQRQAMQQAQSKPTLWTHYTGNAVLPQGADFKLRPIHQNSMCPAALALHHSAAETLLDWAEFGCPTQTGKPWSVLEMEEAIIRNPPISIDPRSARTLCGRNQGESAVKAGLGCQMGRHKKPPTELKILPIAAIPHKLKVYWSILDLFFQLQLKKWRFLEGGE
jgi:hypothetical protein